MDQEAVLGTVTHHQEANRMLESISGGDFSGYRPKLVVLIAGLLEEIDQTPPSGSRLKP